MKSAIKGLMKGAVIALIALGGYILYSVLSVSGLPPFFATMAAILTALLIILGILGLLS